MVSLRSASAQTARSLATLQQKLQESKPDTAKANLLIDMGRYYLNKPGETANDLDSALLLNRQARHLSLALKYNTGIGKSILLESQIYREKGNKFKARQLTETALQFATKHHLLKEIADAYLAFTDLYGIEYSDIEERIKYTENAIPLYKQGGYKKEQAGALKSLGDYYQLQAENTKAVKALEEALAIYQSINFKEVQGVCDLLGYVYARIGNDVLALKYGLMAVKTAEQVRDTSMQFCTICNRLAITYYSLKKNDLAEYYYHKALKTALRYNDAGAIQQIKFNLVVLLIRVHKPERSLAMLTDVIKNYPPNDNIKLNITSLYLFATIYMDMKQLPKAKRYIDSLLSYYKEYGKDFGSSNFLNQPIIRYYFLSRQFTKAYPYLKINDSLARFRHSLITIATNEQNWAKVDSALGNHLSALQHYEEYKIVSDSLKSIDQKKQMSFLQYQFDIDNKNQDILVLKQKGQLQQNRIHTESIIRNAVIGGLIILIIFSGLIYSRYYTKKRSNDLLTIKQTEINNQNELLRKLLNDKEWLLKEIHHRVKNNLQIVISLLNTQSAYLDNEDALFAIRNSQHRMNAISLIHQKLYQSENLAAIDMSVYINELIDYLQESFDTDKRVTYLMDVEPLCLDVGQAVPLGLILNEAISNAMKYAFVAGQKGRIIISLQPYGESRYQLNIADNGVGLPEGFDPLQSSSLGMSLMQGLADQLEGDFKLTTEKGLNVCIIFKPESITTDKIPA